MSIIEYLFFGYATLLMIVGPILNILCSITCFATNLRKYPSFIYIGVIAISDSVALINSQIKSFLATAFKLHPFEDNLPGIKLWIWLATMSAELASLVMVLMTTERILTLKIKMWRKSYFNNKKAVISIMIVFGYLLGLNTPILTSGLINDTNLTIYTRYTSNDVISKAYIQIFGIHFAMIPIPVLIVENAYLIYITLSKSGNIERSEEAIKKRKSISISVVLVTLLFVIFNSPMAIVVAFFVAITDYQNPNFWIFLLSNALQATFETISFFTLYKFNSLFTSEFHNLFNLKRRFQVAPSTNVVTITVGNRNVN